MEDMYCMVCGRKMMLKYKTRPKFDPKTGANLSEKTYYYECPKYISGLSKLLTYDHDMYFVGSKAWKDATGIR
jgi:hypothetical protein